MIETNKKIPVFVFKDESSDWEMNCEIITPPCKRRSHFDVIRTSFFPLPGERF